jgi:hypothetical protein
VASETLCTQPAPASPTLAVHRPLGLPCRHVYVLPKVPRAVACTSGGRLLLHMPFMYTQVSVELQVQVTNEGRRARNKWNHGWENRHTYVPGHMHPLPSPTPLTTTARGTLLCYTLYRDWNGVSNVLCAWLVHIQEWEAATGLGWCWVSCALCWCILSPSTGRRPSHPSWPLSAATLLPQCL